MTNIDCGRAGYKTPKEIELEKRLEVSENEHYRTLEQLRIATKALKEYKEDYFITTYGGRLVNPYPGIARKALKEMEGVK